MSELRILATKIVAWLSSMMGSFAERWRSSSQSCNEGRPSWYSEYAREMTSLSVVDLDVEVCLLDTQATGEKDAGPRRTRKPPDVERALP